MACGWNSLPWSVGGTPYHGLWMELLTMVCGWSSLPWPVGGIPYHGLWVELLGLDEQLDGMGFDVHECDERELNINQVVLRVLLLRTRTF